MLTDIRVLADHFLIAFPNINNHPKCRSDDRALEGPGAHFLPNVSVPASKYLEHKWNLLVIKDAYAMPFFHYFRPVDSVFMCGFYSLSTINNHVF